MPKDTNGEILKKAQDDYIKYKANIAKQIARQRSEPMMAEQEPGIAAQPVSGGIRFTIAPPLDPWSTPVKLEECVKESPEEKEEPPMDDSFSTPDPLVFDKEGYMSYAKMSKDTPPEKRVSVISNKSRLDKLSDTNPWLWKSPFWILKDEYVFFSCCFMQCRFTKEWLENSEACQLYQGGCSTKDTLKEKGYVECKIPGRGEAVWDHPDHVLRYCKRNASGYLYTPMQSSSSLFVCFVTGERYESSNRHTFYIDDRKHPVSVSRRGLDIAGWVIQECQTCGNNYINKLLAERLEFGDKMTCNRCYNKHMEEKVVRKHDDSNFLPAMPDFMDVYRQGGKEKRRIANRRMYGVELEVGFNDGVRAEVAMDAWNTMGHDFCYIKHDGSITNPKKHDGSINVGAMAMGFEIVSAPAGLGVHREKWKKLQKMRYFKLLRSWDTKVCGFHVHVSKDALTQTQVGRILVFVNHPNNRYFIEVVAGRGSNAYTQYHAKKVNDVLVIDENKYTAIRTNKPNTIEFRIFRGTINYKHIIRNLEFCEAVCDYCAPCEVSMRDLADFRHFIKWVSDRKFSYPILADWLATIDLVAKKKLKEGDVIDISESINDEVAPQLAMMTSISKSGKSIESAIRDGQIRAPKVEAKYGELRARPAKKKTAVAPWDDPDAI